ncbi:hypothetical protein ANME2D_00043 [Candidatus Methanoperedens nitroreducens]|uniref:WD40 repeat-containing protein n=1 Tax=Candidatus Methanoperedens nitratireducens TaxID=1392998 RepID=A0A062VBD3_9EURY|nr:DUF5711 family protein [Candidatus Methanoperedens nitroreducens]KCZ72984.1 hypothetical protein ANME2D_00043 [Candidatus Methanoperedens nitroreducens]MDJ1423072.1 DUF5711 family protein [Candidatus Methanoperedens sp.]
MELFEKDKAVALNEKIDNYVTLLWRYDINTILCECSFNYVSISLSPDSIIAAVMSVAEGGNKVYFFNRQGKRLFKSNDSRFSISSDGSYIVSEGYEFFSLSFKVVCFNRVGSILWSYKLKYISSISISSNSLYIVVEGHDTVYFFNRDGELLWSYKMIGWAHSISISSDGSCIAAGSYDRKTKNGKVYFFNKDGTLLWHYNFTYRIQTISVSSDGSYIAIAVGSKGIFEFSVNPLQKLSRLLMKKTSDEDKPEYNEVYFFNQEGILLWSHKIDYKIYNVMVSTDGSFVTVKGHDKICFFNREGKQLWSHKIDDPFHGVSFSSDCSYIAIKDKDTVYFFNREGIQLWNHTIDSPIRCVFVSSDGLYIAVDSLDMIYFFNREGYLLWSYKIDRLRGVSVSSDGLHIAAWKSDKVYFFKIRV